MSFFFPLTPDWSTHGLAIKPHKRENDIGFVDISYADLLFYGKLLTSYI